MLMRPAPSKDKRKHCRSTPRCFGGTGSILLLLALLALAVWLGCMLSLSIQIAAFIVHGTFGTACHVYVYVHVALITWGGGVQRFPFIAVGKNPLIYLFLLRSAGIHEMQVICSWCTFK